MDLKEFQHILKIGETVAVEFKRCGNGIESDVYELVCSFLNRFGGDIFMGVLNDGTVVGVPLNDAYSFDFGTGTADKKPESADKVPINADKCR